MPSERNPRTRDRSRREVRRPRRLARTPSLGSKAGGSGKAQKSEARTDSSSSDSSSGERSPTPKRAHRSRSRNTASAVATDGAVLESRRNALVAGQEAPVTPDVAEPPRTAIPPGEPTRPAAEPDSGASKLPGVWQQPDSACTSGKEAHQLAATLGATAVKQEQVGKWADVKDDDPAGLIKTLTASGIEAKAGGGWQAKPDHTTEAYTLVSGNDCVAKGKQANRVELPPAEPKRNPDVDTVVSDEAEALKVKQAYHAIDKLIEKRPEFCSRFVDLRIGKGPKFCPAVQELVRLVGKDKAYEYAIGKWKDECTFVEAQLPASLKASPGKPSRGKDPG